MTRSPLALALVVAATVSPPGRADDPPPAVRVTVVVVLAGPADKGVDPRLAALAEEVRKKDKTLVGFRIAGTASKSILVGSSQEFALVDDQSLSVAVKKPKDADGRVGLTISPPGLGDITYSCTCGKYFPVVTPYKTATGEQLIVAVMGKPCTGGKK